MEPAVPDSFVSPPKLRVWVERCMDLPRAVCTCSGVPGRIRRRLCEHSGSVAVRVREIQPTRGDPRKMPMPSTYIFDGGIQEPNGRMEFPQDRRARFVETHRIEGWCLRFEVMDERDLGGAPIAFAEIEVTDLARRPVWNLLLSDPNYSNALYGADRPATDGEEAAVQGRRVRPPSFIQVRTDSEGGSSSSSPANGVGGSLPSTAAPTSDDAAGPQKLEVENSPTGPPEPAAAADLASSPSMGRPASPRRPRSPTGRWRVLIMTRGTRGDVQPYVALARGLILQQNCEVIICTELVWKKFIMESKQGLPPNTLHFRPSGGDTKQQTQSDLAVMALRLGQSYDLIQAVALSKSEQNFFTSEGCFFYWAAKERPDYIVFAFTVTHIAMIVSEALQIPIVGFFLQPAHEIEQRPDTATVMGQMLGPVRELVGSQNFNAMLMQIMELIPEGGVTLNIMRRSRGLAPFPKGIDMEFLQYTELTRQNVPQVVPINPQVVEQQLERMKSEGLTLTDFIFLRRSADKLDPEVGSFIAQAHEQKRPVVAMTMSSMPVGERKILEAAVVICEKCRPPAPAGEVPTEPCCIALVSDQGFDPVPDGSTLQTRIATLVESKRLLVLRRPIAFGALFPELDAIILHGGLGVTSEALLAGIPTVITGILLLDQRYWAARVSELGCGPPAIYIDDLLLPPERPRVIDVMKQALDRRETPGSMRTKAREIQRKLYEAAENGEPDGIAINARTVHEFGKTAQPLRNTYAQYQGCMRNCTRQALCCCRLCDLLLRWFIKRQVPACVRLYWQCAIHLCCRCCLRRRPRSRSSASYLAGSHASLLPV